MGYLAWLFDIAGFAVFLFTSTVRMYGIAAGVCAVGALVGHVGFSRDGADLEDRVRSLRARNSSIASVVIIGVYIGMKLMKLD